MVGAGGVCFLLSQHFAQGGFGDVWRAHVCEGSRKNSVVAEGEGASSFAGSYGYRSICWEDTEEHEVTLNSQVGYGNGGYYGDDDGTSDGDDGAVYDGDGDDGDGYHISREPDQIGGDASTFDDRGTVDGSTSISNGRYLADKATGNTEDLIF